MDVLEKTASFAYYFFHKSLDYSFYSLYGKFNIEYPVMDNIAFIYTLRSLNFGSHLQEMLSGAMSSPAKLYYFLTAYEYVDILYPEIKDVLLDTLSKYKARYVGLGQPEYKPITDLIDHYTLLHTRWHGNRGLRSAWISAVAHATIRRKMMTITDTPGQDIAKRRKTKSGAVAPSAIFEISTPQIEDISLNQRIREVKENSFSPPSLIRLIQAMGINPLELHNNIETPQVLEKFKLCLKGFISDDPKLNDPENPIRCDRFDEAVRMLFFTFLFKGQPAVADSGIVKRETYPEIIDTETLHLAALNEFSKIFVLSLEILLEGKFNFLDYIPIYEKHKETFKALARCYNKKDDYQKYEEQIIALIFDGVNSKDLTLFLNPPIKFLDKLLPLLSDDALLDLATKIIGKLDKKDVNSTDNQELIANLKLILEMAPGLTIKEEDKKLFLDFASFAEISYAMKDITPRYPLFFRDPQEKECNDDLGIIEAQFRHETKLEFKANYQHLKQRRDKIEELENDVLTKLGITRHEFRALKLLIDPAGEGPIVPSLFKETLKIVLEKLDNLRIKKLELTPEAYKALLREQQRIIKDIYDLISPCKEFSPIVSLLSDKDQEVVASLDTKTETLPANLFTPLFEKFLGSKKKEVLDIKDQLSLNIENQVGERTNLSHANMLVGLRNVFTRRVDPAGLTQAEYEIHERDNSEFNIIAYTNSPETDESFYTPFMKFLESEAEIASFAFCQGELVRLPMPQIVGNTHWVAVTAQKIVKEDGTLGIALTYQDSLGQTVRPAIARMIDGANKLIEERNASMSEDTPIISSCELTIKPSQERQTDGNSCGYHTLYNLYLERQRIIAKRDGMDPAIPYTDFRDFMNRHKTLLQQEFNRVQIENISDTKLTQEYKSVSSSVAELFKKSSPIEQLSILANTRGVIIAEGLSPEVYDQYLGKALGNCVMDIATKIILTTPEFDQTRIDKIFTVEKIKDDIRLVEIIRDLLLKEGGPTVADIEREEEKQVARDVMEDEESNPSGSVSLPSLKSTPGILPSF